MTRLVLHAGAELADGGTAQQDLMAWRADLERLGVVLPGGETPTAWRETGLGLIKPKGSAAATELLARAEESGAEIVLISSDALSDALTSPQEVSALVERASAAGLEVRVVVVVREQIGYINSLYCRRVLGLETARSFLEFATTSVPAHRFDYVAAFGALADTPGVELVAVGYPAVLATGGGRAVLEAAGLSPDALAALPAEGTAVPEPAGPVLVGAVRLLHKRLRRQGGFNEHGKPRLRVVADQLAAHAVSAGWDSEPFWGWDPGLRRRIEEEYKPTDDIFAQFVWGTDWPEPWSAGKPNRADLADLRPPVLRDVFETIQRLLNDLEKHPARMSYDEDDHLADADDNA